MNRLRFLSFAATLCALGCSSDPSAPTSVDHRYWQLVLDHRAVTLSTAAGFDTVQLTATPRTVDGTAIESDAHVVYSGGNLSVTVSETGLVTAHDVSSAVPVVAKLTIGQLTLRDTVWIAVTDAAPPLPTFTTLSIQPFPGDSAISEPGGFVTLDQQILDQNGDPIPGALMAFRSADTTLAQIDESGTLNALVPGKVMIYAEATVYGVTRVDSLRFTIGQPTLAQELILTRPASGGKPRVSYFSPSVMTVSPGATVIFANSSIDSVDIVFDDPSAAKQVPPDFGALIAFLYGEAAAADSGNIASFAPMDSTGGQNGNGFRARTFPNIGNFTYHSTLHGTTGTISVVKD